MNKEKLTKAIELLKGVVTDLEAVAEDTKEVKATPNKKGSKVEAKKAVKEEEDETPSLEDLKAMAFNDLKKYAKEVGVKAVGGKDAILASIVEALGIEDDATEEAPAPKKDVKGKKDAKAKKVDDEDEDDSEDNLAEKVEAELAEMSDEEIKDILDEAGISAKGKRQALIAKVIKGIEEGTIEWSDDEEDTDDEDTDDDDTDDDDTDDEDVEDTEERTEAIEKLDKDIRKKFKAKKLTMKEIDKVVKDFYEAKDFKKMKDEDKLDAYIEIQQSLVDDEGEIHDFEEPYEVKGVVYCCGSPAKAVDDGYICETCGGEYEGEEE